MAELQFADISYYQNVVNNSYPHRWIAFRANDGTFRDPHFAANLAWAKSAVASNRLDGFIVYVVWETNWQDTVNTLKSMVGTPHPKMSIMMDVESWAGKIRGNQSAGLNAARENLIAWLGGNRLRVWAYGNSSDLNALWPSRGDVKINLAYWSSSRPAFANKIAQQVSASVSTSPFGTCDLNVTPYTSAQFATLQGIGTPIPPPAPPKPDYHKVPPGPARVNSPGSIHPGTALVSPNKRYVASLQLDGNFVVYDWLYDTAKWSSMTNGKGTTVCSVQSDGNVVLYAGKKVLWSSHTFGHGNVFLQMQNDGVLALYPEKGGTALWYVSAK